MNYKPVPFSGKAVWQNNKPFAWFLLSLLLLHSLLKIIFYQYNHALLFTGAAAHTSIGDKAVLIKWSLAMDLLTVLGINTLFLFSLAAVKLAADKLSARLAIPLGWLLVSFFVLLNSFALLLNLADIFYFGFHFQRANADLFYVLDHPFQRLAQQSFFILLAGGLLVVAVMFLLFRLHRKFFSSFIKGDHCKGATIILLVLIVFFFFSRNSFSKYLVPTYPMVQLKSNQLPVVQNSFHSFLFSVFRNEENTLQQNYMSDAEADSLMPIRKQLHDVDSSKKNIVLFIMESVPYDFFDNSSAYKVAMPFFDSLLNTSTFFNNAFCYAHESNKGITAILAGIPTITDVPVYHSQYIHLPITPIGSTLKKLHYRSLFCIGDEYDNFGFAKCMNWLGFDQYYSEEDMPGYKKLPAHTMGLQDEYVLDFFGRKISEQADPFFAVHYNISTHYPYDIPATYAKTLPPGYSPAMKAMRYYDHSLSGFFNTAKNQSWFHNTTFIFCADHWMFPEGKKGKYSELSSYRIPIIIYDPARPEKKIINQTVSQFDILGTVLRIAGYRDSIISFGNHLTDSSAAGQVVFTKANANLYQAIDSNYVLGYNSSTNKNEFLYNYTADKMMSRNLVNEPAARLQLQYLNNKVQAFLQKAKMQANAASFK